MTRFCIWVIDCLEPDALSALKSALKKALNLLTLSRVADAEVCVGLCFIRFNAGSNVELKFVLKAAPVCLPKFYAAVDLLEPSSDRSDGTKLAAVLKKVIERVETAANETQRDDSEWLKEVRVVSQRLQCDAVVHRVLKLASKRDIHLHFHACNPDLPSGDSDGVALMHEVFAEEVGSLENVTFESALSSAAFFDVITMTWIRDLLPNTATPLKLTFPVEGSREGLQFPCVASKEYLSLESSFHKGQLCTCHHTPVLMPTAQCSVSKKGLKKQECSKDVSVVQIGSTLLKVGPSQQHLVASPGEGDRGLTVVHRLPIHAVTRHALGYNVQLFYDITEDDFSGKADLFSNLCHTAALHKEVFLAKSYLDLEQGCTCHIPQLYTLIPSQDGSVLHAFQTAPSESRLPSRRFFSRPSERSEECLQAVEALFVQIPRSDISELPSSVHSLLNELLSGSAIHEQP